MMGLRVTLEMGFMSHRFKNTWLEHPSFKSYLSLWWNVTVLCNLEGYSFMVRTRG